MQLSADAKLLLHRQIEQHVSAGGTMLQPKLVFLPNGKIWAAEII